MYALENMAVVFCSECCCLEHRRQQLCMQATERELQAENEANSFVQLPVPADWDKTKTDPLLTEAGARFYVQ